MAEGVGFEPTRRDHRLTHFECAAFGRSATPPNWLSLSNATDGFGDGLLPPRPKKPPQHVPAFVLQDATGYFHPMV